MKWGNIMFVKAFPRSILDNILSIKNKHYTIISG